MACLLCNFLPAGGVWVDAKHDNPNKRAYYWTINYYNSTVALCVILPSNEIQLSPLCTRYLGCSVRAIQYINYSDLNLVKCPFSIIPNVYLFKTLRNILCYKYFKSISYL